MSRQSASEKLDGWKAIADHLGKSVRTAQRWETDLRLPIRRLADADEHKSASVFAYSAELDAWWDEHFRGGAPSRPSAAPKLLLLRLPRAVLWGGVAVVLLLGLGAYLSLPSASQPYVLRALHDSELGAFDQDGNLLWSRLFSTPFASLPQSDHFVSEIADIDGDGSKEVLFALAAFEPQPGPDDGLYCFSAAGEELWYVKPGRAITIDDVDYRNAFKVRDFAIGTDGEARSFVALAATHRPYAPTQVLVVDAAGNRVGEYWHFGYLLTVMTGDFDGDAVDEVLLGGINNALADPDVPSEQARRQQAVLALIEHDLQGAISPGPREVPNGLVRNRELAYISFPLPQLFDARWIGSRVQDIRPFDAGVYVDVTSADSEVRGLVYEFDRRLQLERLTMTPGYKRLHRAALEEGRVTLTLPEEELRLTSLDRLVGDLPGSVATGR